MAAGGEHRPLVVFRAEEPVGDLVHVDEVFEVRADAAQDAEDHLHEEMPARPREEGGAWI